MEELARLERLRTIPARPCLHLVMVNVGASAGMFCKACGAVWVRRRRPVRQGGRTVTRMVRTRDSIRIERELWAELAHPRPIDRG